MSITGGKDRTKHAHYICVDRPLEASVGRSLMEAGIMWAERSPIVHKLALHVLDNERAVDLYRRGSCGRRLTGSFRSATARFERLGDGPGLQRLIPPLKAHRALRGAAPAMPHRSRTRFHAAAAVAAHSTGHGMGDGHISP